MLNFDNSHIFTGYLKQFLSSFNMPTCRVYTSENQRYFEVTGKEAAAVIESASLQNSTKRVNISVPYLKDGNLYIYQLKNPNNSTTKEAELEYSWRPCRNFNFRENVFIPGLTKTLDDPGSLYTTTTHEYLGDFLRFYRDSTNINLMPLYNCFNKKLCNNINIYLSSEDKDKQNENQNENEIVFRASDSQYKIYMLPVKLFESYTIAIDCAQGIEMFCGLYGNDLDVSDKGKDLIKRTYQNFNQTFFNQPFLYEKLSAKFWGRKDDITEEQKTIEAFLKDKVITRWDIINRERDLKLFIKIPASNKSSITILEGNYLNFNDCKYEISESKLELDNDAIEKVYAWAYSQNTFVSNFEKTSRLTSDYLPVLSERPFKPIGKLQLLAMNTGTSYPFSNRLVEYLSNSVITPEDTISDNIRRVQKVMENNGYLFNIPGIWEPSMQKIIYDYLKNDGPYTVVNKNKNYKDLPQKDQIKNRHQGLHTTIGHNNRDSYYDVLGFVDKDAEKFYASWKVATEKTENDGLKITSITPTTVQNVDIYNNLYKED